MNVRKIRIIMPAAKTELNSSTQVNFSSLNYKVIIVALPPANRKVCGIFRFISKQLQETCISKFLDDF